MDQDWKFPAIGLLNNEKGRGVTLRDVVLLTVKRSEPLEFVAGIDAHGKPYAVDLAKDSNLLIVGVPGSGKSSFVHQLLTSLIYKNIPTELKLIILDPSGLELKAYDGIPHLLTPVISEVEKSISALKWAVAEIERRYKTIQTARKRNIQEYNDGKDDEGMSEILVVIDNLPDLMAYAFRDIEALVYRIAQRGRVAGVRLVLTTYNVSTEILNKDLMSLLVGVVSFQLASESDSRTLLGITGAESLTRPGDMVLKTKLLPQPVLLHSAIVRIDEINKIAESMRGQGGPDYDNEIGFQPVVSPR